MKSVVNLAVLCQVTLAGLSICVSVSLWATECVHPRTALEGAYDRAQAIFVAEVSGCADRELPDHGRCPDERYTLSVIEVLKGSVPVGNFGGVVEGSADMGCGLVYRVGQEYLLFIDGAGNVDQGASGYLSGDGPRTTESKERLGNLRQYRDGRSSDLSEPWRFWSPEQACRVSHLFDGGEIELTFGYGDGSHYRSQPLTKTYGPNGEVRVDTGPDAPKEDSLHGVMIGPDFGKNALLFSVTLEDPVYPESVSIKVGDRVWPLPYRSIRMRFGEEARLLISEHVAGRETANEIFEAMIESTDIAISATASDMAAEGVKDSKLLFATRSTRLPTSAKKFKDCVEEIVRRNNVRYP